MPKDSFLFVPYHVGQQSPADAKLTSSDARSHAAAVSRQRRDFKKLRNQLGLQDLRTIVSTAADAATPSDTDTALYDIQHNDSHSTEDGSASKEKSSKLVLRRQHMRAMQFSWRAGNVSANMKISNGLGSEPFGFLPSTEYGRAVVDYYMQVISPVNQPIYAIFNVTNVYTSYWMELLQDEDYRPAGLAMVGAIMHRICQPGSQSCKDVRTNQATAISRLERKYNDALSSGSSAADDIAIITVLALASLARFLGDLKAYETHRNSMKAMVRSRGGLSSLGQGGLVKCLLLQWDSFWVFETEGAPLFLDSRPKHVPVYPAFPLTADLRMIFVRLPVGFQSLILKGKISVEMMETLGRAADASSYGISAVDAGNMCHSELRKYNDFVEACPCLGAQDEAKLFIEKAICLALLLFCANAFTQARSMTALYAASRMELTRLLESMDEELYRLPERECLYWIYVVCVDSWRQSGPQSNLLAKGQGLLPVLKQLNDLTSKNILQKFFYNQGLLEACGRYLEMAG